MRRTQIYLPEGTYRALTKMGRDKKQSMAQVIRDLLSRQLLSNGEAHEEDLTSLAKLQISGGPKDLSSRFDEYLYGK